MVSLGMFPFLMHHIHDTYNIVKTRIFSRAIDWKTEYAQWFSSTIQIQAMGRERNLLYVVFLRYSYIKDSQINK